MAITPKPAGTISPPNNLGAESAGSISIPNNLTSQAGGIISPPNTLTPNAAGSVSIPNTLSAQSAGSISAPSTLTAQTPGQWPASSGPTPPTRQDFYYYFGNTGSQTLRTEELIITDTSTEDFQVDFYVGSYGFTGADQTFISQGGDSTTQQFWLYANPDDLFVIHFGGTEVLTGVDVGSGVKHTFKFVGSTYEILKDDVSVETGSITRTAYASSLSTIIGSRRSGASYTKTLSAVIYSIGFTPLNGASFTEHLYLLDENSDATVEYYSQTQLATWINYNAANWQGTP